MDLRRMRAMILAGVMAGSAIAAGNPVAAGGIPLECEAGLRGGGPDRVDGWMTGLGRGSCTVPASYGAPWDLRVIARLQRRQAGTWRTQAIASSWSEADFEGTKTIEWISVAAPCTSAARRTWRIRITAQARLDEKSVTVLTSDTIISPTRRVAC